MSIFKVPHESGGEVWQIRFSSSLLATNPSRFPSVRYHRAFVPPNSGAETFPVLYYLAPWMSSGRAAFQWEPFREDLASRVMRLIDQGAMQPCVVVAPDMYTDFGGSQYTNSAWLGPHASHIIQELIPFVEENLPVRRGFGARGVFGRSSGGFGAFRLASDFPGVFSAVACHSGDMGFDWSARRSLIDLCTALVKFNHPLEYIAWTAQQKKLSGWDTHILMLLGSCAFYSPNPDEPWGFDLPIDLKTGDIIESIYSKWISNDPVNVAKKTQAQAALSDLKLLFIDCGNRDQYYLQYGARLLTKVLREAGVKHTYQEFDDNHSGTSYRFDESLPRLVRSLAN